MLKVEFFKICVSGDDFILIDNRKKIFNTDHQENIVELMCARKYAVGANGVCFIEQSESAADYQVRFFLSSGEEIDFCGNALRAAIRYANEKEIAGISQVVQTKAGLVTGEVFDEIIKASYPATEEVKLHYILEIPHEFDVKKIDLSYVHIGTKSLVIEVDKVSVFDVKHTGKMFCNHTSFQPEGINTTFYDVIDLHNLNVSVYEFCNEVVNSSSDGAVVAYLVAENKGQIKGTVITHFNGGLMKLSRGSDNIISIEGEARVSYVGYITSEMLNFDIEKTRVKNFYY